MLVCETYIKHDWQHFCLVFLWLVGTFECGFWMRDKQAFYVVILAYGPNHFASHFHSTCRAAFSTVTNGYSFYMLFYGNRLTHHLMDSLYLHLEPFHFHLFIQKKCFNWYYIITWGTLNMTEKKNLIKMLICDIKTIWFFRGFVEC